MRIIDAIGRINRLKPNAYAIQDKVWWLSTLDGRIKKDIIDTHEGGEDVIFTGYSEDGDTAIDLLVPAPYDILYVYWLEAQIDYANGEYSKYSNSMTMFNEAYSAFEKYYNRNHMPKGKKFKFF
jgi:hypothetical protein